MKRRFVALAGAALLALAGQQVSAADLPLKAAPRAVAPTFSWGGYYVGLHSGYAWGDAELFVPGSAASGTPVAHPDSYTFGGHVGYRRQINAWVLGGEADLSWLDGDNAGVVPNFPSQSFRAKTRWDASLRGVLGYTFNRWMVYATGGWSWLSIFGCGETTGVAVCLTDTSVTRTIDGWTAGGGLAYAYSDNLIARLEYLYADYGTFTFTGAGITGNVANLTTTTNKVRAGLSLRFAGP